MEYPLDLPGGAQMSTLSICEGLVKHKEYDYEPVVICPKLLSSVASDYPFRILEYDMGESRIKNLLIRIKAFRKYIDGERPDLIHIEMSESLITYGFIRGRFKDRKFIYTDRGLLFGYRKRSRLFMFPVLEKCDMLVTTTEFNAGLWKNETKIRPISTIPNTISSKYFGDFDPGRKKHDDTFTVGLAGRICVEKDWDFAVEFIGSLKKRIDDLKVNIVLSTFEKGDDEKVESILNSLKKILGRENLEYALNLSQEEMSDFYYKTDVFLMTSCFESFGKAAVEAMSRKCAVVSTRVGGLPEVIGDERYLYTKGDPSKGIECIKRLHDNRDELISAGEYFYGRYKKYYTEEAYIENHRRLYDGII